MKLSRLILFFAILSLLIPTTSLAFEGIDHTYAALLASGQTKKAKIVAEALFLEGSDNIELLDIISELLSRGSKAELDMTSDDLAWLAKSLGHSRLSRYRKVLQQADADIAILEARYKAARKPGNDDEDSDTSDLDMIPQPPVTEMINRISFEVNHSKVRSYISDALKRLSIKTNVQFIAGKMDLKALQEKIEVVRKTGFKDRGQIEFSKIGRGMSIYDIYGKIGLPDYEAYFNITRHRPFIGGVLVPQIQVTYRDKGTIQFINDNVKNGRVVWRVYKVFPQIKVTDYGDEPEGLIDKLKSNNPGTIRKAAKIFYQEETLETETLDIVATVIWKYRNTDDRIMADAIAWLCKVVGKSKNSRYQTLISEVSKISENSKIERYAEKQLDLFEDENVPQFLEYSQ